MSLPVRLSHHVRQQLNTIPRRSIHITPPLRAIHHFQTRPAIPAIPRLTSTQQWCSAATKAKYTLRGTWKSNPVLTTIALASIAFGVTFLAYFSYLYYRMYQLLGNYPENVGLKLRRGIYFTDIQEDFPQAIRAYLQALKLAVQEKMDPLGDEVIGIKMELVRCLEKANNFKGAIEICESIKKDSLEWIKEHEREEGMRGSRTRLLSWSCKIATRLGDLYADPHVANAEKSEENLVWAVETNIREKQRRDKEGVKEGEGDWLDGDDLGSQLESLGHHYEAKDKHFYAAQLFLQALVVKPKKDCHAVILMNNLATALAQQIPPTEPGVPPPSRAELRESGRSWLKQSLALAGSIQPPERTEECDRGCVAATHNLGEFAEMDGNVAEARRRYEESGSLAHAIGFLEGVNAADEGLRRLEKGGSPVEKSRKRWW